ncbi:sensor histidine kinase [Paenibacillus harenae]|uniref:sensor histidine kinase n=1 Tax=Paenibacillus harenae TaxID=306543 RepID=UPI00041EA193|nr:histidine kinase [Paenibacillus harenae]
MSYKQIKWLILIIPTLTIGLWEYIRHEYLLAYISMELGNMLAPVIVFSVTILFLTKLFSILEQIQEELQRSRALQAAMQERESLARELHDGIAQSLFLLSVKVNRMEARDAVHEGKFQSVRQTVHEVNEYVRQAIANLRYPPEAEMMPWMESLHRMVQEFNKETDIAVRFDWTLPEDLLSRKEKVGLFGSVREALLNVRKHADAQHVRIQAKVTPNGWLCSITDDGQGYEGDPFHKENRFGLKIMKERAAELGWLLQLSRVEGHTRVEIRREV